MEGGRGEFRRKFRVLVDFWRICDNVNKIRLRNSTSLFYVAEAMKKPAMKKPAAADFATLNRSRNT